MNTLQEIPTAQRRQHRAGPFMAFALAVLSTAPVQSATSAADNAAFKAERETRRTAALASRPPEGPAIAAVLTQTQLLLAAYTPSPGSPLEQPSVIWRAETEPTVIHDIAVGPRMVVVPAGEFTMGSPSSEPGHRRDEVPRHRVRIARPFAASMFPITYGEYAWFVGVTGRKSSGQCRNAGAGTTYTPGTHDWDNPGFPQVTRSPVSCIAYGDAVAYAEWLSQEAGHHYRLPSEAEYEYIDRAGTAGAYWWGNDYMTGCMLINGRDGHATAGGSNIAGDCADGFAFTKPLDQSKPNGFGLYDTAGNVASWTSDCWRSDYDRAPADGSARSTGDCRSRAVRGGSWASAPTELRSAARSRALSSEANAERGFRLVREL